MTVPNTDKDVKKLDFLYITDKNVKCHSHHYCRSNLEVPFEANPLLTAHKFQSWSLSREIRTYGYVKTFCIIISQFYL